MNVRKDLETRKDSEDRARSSTAVYVPLLKLLLYAGIEFVLDHDRLVFDNSDDVDRRSKVLKRRLVGGSLANTLDDTPRRFSSWLLCLRASVTVTARFLVYE